MDTFSIRDLRERSGDLVRELEAGHLALITKHGRPVGVTVPMTEALLQRGVPLALAIELFRVHAVSLGLAARIAGLATIEFLEELGRLGIPAVDYDPAELDAELKALE
jgi:prevent-host-death family protein